MTIVNVDVHRDPCNFARVVFDDGEVRDFHMVWLRESCRCVECRYPVTMRRRVEGLTVSPELVALDVEIASSGEALELVWPDRHVTVFGATWLRDHAPAPHPLPSRLHGRQLWGAELGGRLPKIDFASATGDDAGRLRWLELVTDVGFVIMTGVPRDRAVLRRLAESIGPLRASNYGDDWEIEATIDPNTAVDSGRALRAHTDLPYRETPPGLQFLLCDVSEVSGGASTLVDGYRVAEYLRAAHRSDWKVLTNEPITFSYSDATHDLRHSAPIIGLRHDTSYGVIRHAPGLLEPLGGSPEDFDRAYGALHRFTELLADPRFEVEVRLGPGEMVVFDNHRVLHGRRAFDIGSGGRRHMYGAYVDIDDVHSCIRTLRRSLER